MSLIRRIYSALILALLLPGTLFGQGQPLGRIIGQARTARGDFPPHQIFVELRLHGGVVESVYADNEGHFGFSNLHANGYRIVINDDDYYPVDERADVNPESTPYTRVQIMLQPRESKQNDDPVGARAAGGNPYLVDPSDYNKHFPKKALKEYDRGVNAERKGDRDEAATHYLGALAISPDYYPAHNNLGLLYLGKADFKSAEEQFQEVIRLDQNDAQAYFNLGNVLMLTGRYPESEKTLASGLQRQPASAFGSFLQGSLYERTGKLMDAEKSLRTALQLDSKMWQAHLELVNVYLRGNQRDNAIFELQTFLKGFPSVPSAAKANELLLKLQSQNQTSQPPQ
jgi:tetratricopeptide (TPR) repeat protein